MNILVFGAQGSGKSTHAKYIADKLEIPYIYTGDLFRNLENENSERGRKIKVLMKQGVLIPNELSIPAFKEYLNKFDILGGVVLDGYPRNIEQAQSLSVKIDLIIRVNLLEKIAIERLKERGRYDDNPEGIKKRLEMFYKQTEPIFDYFKNKGIKIAQIDNSPALEEVRLVVDDLLKNQK